MKKAFLVLILASLMVFGAAAQAEAPADPGFAIMTFAGPFSVGIKTYKDYDGTTAVEEMSGAFKVGLILGPRIFHGSWGTVYAVATPYYYGFIDYGDYEYGTGMGVFYFGTPAFLGLEIPVYASGTDSGASYTVSFGDFHKTSFLIGATASYQRKALWGGTRNGRIFGAFKLSYTDPGDNYLKYTSIGLILGGTL